VDLLNKIHKFESELQAKDKENKLLQMKLKESEMMVMPFIGLASKGGASVRSNSFIRFSTNSRANLLNPVPEYENVGHHSQPRNQAGRLIKSA
jgi:hypothetical protein